MRTSSIAISLSLTLTLTLTAGAAHAARDIAVSIVQTPAPSLVYASAAYRIRVSGVGNQRSYAGSLTITLPTTNTSPQVYVMGTLGALPSGCTRSGGTVTCPVQRLYRNETQDFIINLAAPQSALALEMRAAVTSSQDNNASNNNATHVLDLDNVDHEISSTVDSDVNNSHCTGTGLSSYYECTLFPSSISSHTAVFHADGTITMPAYGPEYGGRWSQPNDNLLTFNYTENGATIATFVGASVHNANARCFEGITSFPGSTYVSPYRVCVTPRSP